MVSHAAVAQVLQTHLENPPVDLRRGQHAFSRCHGPRARLIRAVFAPCTTWSMQQDQDLNSITSSSSLTVASGSGIQVSGRTE